MKNKKMGRAFLVFVGVLALLALACGSPAPEGVSSPAPEGASPFEEIAAAMISGPSNEDSAFESAKEIFIAYENAEGELVISRKKGIVIAGASFLTIFKKGQVWGTDEPGEYVELGAEFFPLKDDKIMKEEGFYRGTKESVQRMSFSAEEMRNVEAVCVEDILFDRACKFQSRTISGNIGLSPRYVFENEDWMLKATHRDLESGDGIFLFIQGHLGASFKIGGAIYSGSMGRIPFS